VVSVAALLYLSTASSVAELIVGWVLAQAAVNAMFSPIVAAIPDLVPPAERGVAGGLIAVSQTAGIALASGIPYLTGSIRGGYALAAVLLVALAIPYLLHSRDVPLRPGELAAARASRVSKADRTAEHTAKDAAVRHDFRWAFVTRFLMWFGNSLMLLFLFYYLQDQLELGKDKAVAGMFMLTATYALVAAVTAVIGGRWSDKVGKRKPFVIGSGLVTSVAFGLLVVGDSFAMTLVAAIVLGVGFGAYQSVDFALITQVLPGADGRGRDMGILNVAAGLPQFVAPMVSIALIAGYGVNYQLIFGLGGVVSIAGSLLVRQIRGVE
jgi:MFS family permease